MPQLSERQSDFLKKHLGCCPPVSAAENEALAKLSPEELAKTDLTKVDVDSLFTKDAMDALREVEIKGEGTPEMKRLMREITNGFPTMSRESVMEALEGVVGTPPDAKKLNLDYDRFLIVQKQQEAIGASGGEKNVPLNEDMHPDFMGSRGQLLSGKVVGDAFGIHEIFGSLLNPTGGLVGAGNHFAHPMIPIKAAHLDPDNPIAVHGIVHDAGGYLNTYHDEGPGYDYLESDIEFLSTDHPLAGQISGIAYWTMEVGDEYFIKRVDAAVMEVENALKSVRDAVANTVDNMMSVFRSDPDSTVPADDENVDTANAIEDAFGKAARAAEQIYDSIIPGPAMAAQAKKKLDAMSSFVWN